MTTNPTNENKPTENAGDNPQVPTTNTGNENKPGNGAGKQTNADKKPKAGKANKPTNPTNENKPQGDQIFFVPEFGMNVKAKNIKKAVEKAKKLLGRK